MIAMKNYLEHVSPYFPSERADCFTNKNLDWNEGFADLSGLFDRETFDIDKLAARLNSYSDPSYKSLQNASESFYKNQVVRGNFEVLSFAGSDAAISAVARAFLSAGDEVLVAHPSYDNAIVEFAAQTNQLSFFEMRVKQDFEHFIDICTKSQPKLIYIVNPNNPIGYSLELEKIRELAVQNEETVILIDEAYIEFTTMLSASTLIQSCPNVFVTRTMSKAFSLAALRVGFLMCSPSNANVIKKVRNTKAIAYLSEVIAAKALNNPLYMKEYVTRVNVQKQELYRFLSEKEKRFFVSDTNFVLINDPNETIISKLKEHSINYRDRSSQMQEAGWFRLTLNPNLNLIQLLNS